MPLDITEQRTGVYEIEDKYSKEDRNKTIQLVNLSLFASILFATSGISLIFWNVSDLLKVVLIALLFILAGLAAYYNFIVRKKLIEEINGLVLRFDESKKVIDFFVRKFQKGKNLDFIEQSVRFNQAIGFKALLDDDGDIAIELIVDPDFPGTPIFRTYDIYALAELILVFQFALPKLKTWIYRMTGGEDWDAVFREELNNEMQVAKVPWVIREFFI